MWNVSVWTQCFLRSFMLFMWPAIKCSEYFLSYFLFHYRVLPTKLFWQKTSRFLPPNCVTFACLKHELNRRYRGTGAQRADGFFFFRCGQVSTMILAAHSSFLESNGCVFPDDSSHTLYWWIVEYSGGETSTLCRPEVSASPRVLCIKCWLQWTV